MSRGAWMMFDAREDIYTAKLLEVSKSILEENKFYFSVRNAEITPNGDLGYAVLNFSDVPFWQSSSRQVIVEFCAKNHSDNNLYNLQNLRSLVGDFGGFDNVLMYQNLEVSGIYDNEDLLLKFIYPLFQNYPTAKLWVEANWFYTLSDLEKIVSNYTADWCYKKPP